MKFNQSMNLDFYSSDFVATRIVHKLYKLCCEKRFRPYEVQADKPKPTKTLYKYLVIPKEAHASPRPQLLQPKTSDQDSASETNSSIPRPLPRSSWSHHEQPSETSDESSSTEHRTRSRSSTLPFIHTTEAQQRRSKRSQSRPKDDEES
jgi:hypothetical protein